MSHKKSCTSHEDEKIKTIENIAKLLYIIEENYSEQDYKIFDKNEKFCFCLCHLQNELTSPNLPLAIVKKANILVGKIQSILMRTGFINLISIWPTETVYKHIIPLMSNSQDKFNHMSLKGKTHKAFACTSKKNKEWVEKTNEAWITEHKALKAQLSDVRSKGFTSCEQAIAYTIEKGYTALDLNDFKHDVTDEIIENLFKEYPHLNHFIVNSNKITKLPACSSLQTLNCGGCQSLTALPAGMTSLEKLNCYDCTALEVLPAGMISLKILYCCGCTALEALPADMTNLQVLNCYRCTALEALPTDMTSLKELDCSGCTALESLPVGMTSLQKLCCYCCTALEALPAGMASLKELYCNSCTALKTLPAGMTSLKELECQDCKSLQALPADMTSLKELICYGCKALKALKALRKDLPASCNIQR